MSWARKKQTRAIQIIQIPSLFFYFSLPMYKSAQSVLFGHTVSGCINSTIINIKIERFHLFVYIYIFIFIYILGVLLKNKKIGQNQASISA